MGRDYARLAFELSDGEFVVKYVTCNDADKGKAERTETLAKVKARKYNVGAKDCYACNVDFRISCAKGALCSLSYSVDGGPFMSVANAFQAREGKWIGAKYGVFSIAKQGSGRGWIDLKY